MALRQYKGSCHCGKVKYEAQIDFTQGTTRCNCTFCTKNRYWSVMAKPENFKLLSSEDCLTDYSRGKTGTFSLTRELEEYACHLPFCKSCGTRTFSVANIPEMGGKYVSIVVASLDDVDFREAMKAPMHYADGRSDDWMAEPDFKDHL